MITTLSSIIQTKDADKHVDLKNCINTLLPKLIYSIVTASLDETAKRKETIILSNEIMLTVHLIIISVLKNLIARFVRFFFLSMHEANISF